MAIVIAHGMGQQIPFQTLDDVAEGLRRQDRKRRKGTAHAGRQNRRAGRRALGRLEMKILTRDGERDVHLYESYWAPMTEGRVTLRDVMGFLLRAGSVRSGSRDGRSSGGSSASTRIIRCLCSLSSVSRCRSASCLRSHGSAW